jgi:ubiquinone/menaquinone biosynthesis C-methylase UbiE
MFSSDEDRVARYYDKDIFEAELQRLPREFPIEMEITKRMLARWIPPGAAVAEIGVGGGHYTEWLVQHGCRVHLVDIAAAAGNRCCQNPIGIAGRDASVRDGPIRAQERRL